jgi:hypothetical protein
LTKTPFLPTLKPEEPFYYYTNGRPETEVSGSHGTLFKNRPGEATAGEITTSLTQKLMPPILLDAWRGLRKRR